MQAYIGGGPAWDAANSAKAAIDEFRISDTVRYAAGFAPAREEFVVDESTRALFHFENDKHGIHGGDDEFVRGYLGCELPPTGESVPLDVRRGNKVQRRDVVVAPHPSDGMFERNRAEARMTVFRPFRKLPDPRFVEYRVREVERVVDESMEGFSLEVGGDYEPQMRAVTFEHAGGGEPTLIPRWRANDSVVPFSVQDLAATLAPNAETDAEEAVEVMKYALKATNYYDAHYCETLPTRHRPRVSYTLIKSLNIYPFDQCGPLNHTLRKLFLAGGISSNNASGTHHQIEQAFFDGSHRLFDLSSRIFWLNRDSETLLSMRGLEEDPYLKLRQGGDCNAWLPGRRSQATFGSAERPHGMGFALRPGERASLSWHNEGRWFELTGDREAIPLAKIPPYFGNGAIVFEPAEQCEGVELDNLEIHGSALRALDAEKPASLTYRAECPYIYSGASARGRHTGDVTLSISTDGGGTWSQAGASEEPTGDFDVDLTGAVSARYAYALRLELAPGSSVTGFRVRSTVVVSPLSLPGKLTRGTNRVTFVGGPPMKPVRTTCSWVERHRSKLGVSLNTLSTYHDEGDAHRNVLIVPPGGEAPLTVTLHGRKAECEVTVEGLPDGWGCRPGTARVKTDGAPVSTTFTVGAPADARLAWFDLIVSEGGHERLVPVQALAAHSALVREAEDADEMEGDAARRDAGELSAAASITFAGDGVLRYALASPTEGPHALWLRARWDEGSSARLSIAIDGQRRELRARGMIGFTDWTDSRYAHTKMFAHYGEQYAHWAWYRIPDVALTQGSESLEIAGGAGFELDALAALPQDPATDRAAMDLFQNWNFAPWEGRL